MIAEDAQNVQTERLAQQAASGLQPFQTISAQTQVRSDLVIIQKDEVEVSRRAIIDFQTGTNTTLSVSDDPVGSRTLIKVNANTAAPTNATYITQTPDATLTNEQALSALATGYLKSTTGTGVVSTQAVPIPAADGGTGISAYAVGDLLYASASTTLSALADVATGNALISGGVTTAPSWGKIGLTTHVSGVLPTANGGVDPSAWASYTPTWTNLTVGNGTVDAKYAQIGKTVFVRISLVFGSTTSVSGSVSVSLPVTSVSYPGTATTQSLGLARFYDSGVGANDGAVLWSSTTTVLLIVFDASGTYLKGAAMNATTPFAWGTSDEVFCEFFYEAA